MATAMARTLIRRKPTTFSSIFSKNPIAARIRPFCAVAECPRRTNSPRRPFNCSKAPPPHLVKEYVATGNPPVPTFVDPYRANYWEVIMILPDTEMSRDEIIDLYVKTLASAEAFGGSEEEARKKIYSVSTHYFFFFICNVSLEIAEQIKKVPRVLNVVPIADRDVKREDFALSGEPFIDGQAVPYDPKYHETILAYVYASSRRNPGEEHLRPVSNNKDRTFAKKIAPRRALQSLIEPPSTKQAVPYDPKYHETILAYVYASSRRNPGEEHLRPVSNNKDRTFAKKIAPRRALQSLIEPPSTKQEVPC